MLEEYVGYRNDLPDIEKERERKMTKAIDNKLLDDFCLQSETTFLGGLFSLFCIFLVLHL